MQVSLTQNRHFKIFKTVAKAAELLNIDAYIVGGFVRDLLLQRTESKDIDFVTEGSGIDLARKTAELLSEKKNIEVTVFKTYGTAMLKYKDAELEFVGARKESYTPDSRNPKVESGSLHEDQERRDFTVNSLAISLNSKSFGEIIDPFNGIKDLDSKILKTPMDPVTTYSDDPLRMMRAIRFATVLDFKIEDKSFQAIKHESERIKIISVERIMTEFNKIMLSPKPSVGLKLLSEALLLEKILPELCALRGIEEVDGQTHKDNFWHTLEVVDNISKNTQNLWLRWAALLHDIGKAPTKKFVEGAGWTFHGHEFLGSKMVKTIFRRLKLPLGNDMEFVQKMIKLSSRPIALITDDASDSALRRLLFDAGEDLEALFTLCKADITTKNTSKQKKFIRNFEYVSEKIKEVEEKDQVRNFQPPVSGEEIMTIFSIKPGREIGILKEKVKEAILEGEIPNEKNSALEFVIKEGKNLGLQLN